MQRRRSLLHCHFIKHLISTSSSLSPNPNPNPNCRWISSLKVTWRKDSALDAAIERDKRWRLCSRVVREVLNEPGRCIPLRYLEKRRERLHLPIKVRTFLSRYPNIFDLYSDRIKPRSDPVPFLRPSSSLLSFLSAESDILSRHEPLALAKLTKLIMMSKDRALPANKLLHVKRVFGFPDDFLTNLVPRHPDRLRLVGQNASFLELVAWDDDLAQSVIDRRAAEESELIGIPVRPNFNVRLPPGFFLRKEMREWVRDWLELPYVSPYADASGLQPASPEMEKRLVGVLHELLSMSVFRRIEVPVIGKFFEEFRFSNAFANAFTRHSGIFYVSLKGGNKTAMLREAYDREGELVDRDPMLEIKDTFLELLEEGHKQWDEQMKTRRETIKKDMELMARKGTENVEDECTAGV